MLARPVTARHIAERMALADLGDDFALSALRFKYGPLGWRVFRSSSGRWQATTTRRPVIDYRRGMIPATAPDAVDDDSPAGLAKKIRDRL